MVFHNNQALIDEVTVVVAAQIAQEVLVKLGMETFCAKYSKQLSGGQKQRLASG